MPFQDAPAALPNPPSALRRSQPRSAYATVAAVLSALLGAVVLVGWAADWPALRSVLPGAVEMKANAALGLLASALVLVLASHGDGSGRRRASDLLSLFVAALGLATACEYAFGLNLGIDELLVRDHGAAFNHAKGRMSPYSAVALLALGAAGFGLWRPRLGALARAAAGIVVAIGALSLLGYLWNASEIVTDQVAPPVAVNTACGFILLGTALLRIAVPLPPDARQRGRSRLETLLLRGFVPTALFIVIGGGLTYRAGADFALTTERVAHAQEVRAELGRLYSSVVDAEVARRNQVLIGDAGFDTAYLANADEARDHLARLARLVADNAAQSEQQQRLTRLIDTRLRALDGIGQVLRVEGAIAAREALRVDARQGLMEQVRALTEAMDATEASLLKARLGLAKEQRKLTLISLLLTLALLTAVFLLLFQSIRREVLARSLAEESLQRLNADLEQRVAERTAELSQLSVDLERRVEARTQDLYDSNRKLEQARLDSEAASRAKSAFLANMSHEIRTPMNAVIGLTHLMLREATDSRQRGRLGKVADAAQHLLQVINDILDMSKIEAGKLTLDDAEFSLDTVLTRATEMVGARARDKGLELIVDSDHLPNHLRGDATRLSQVLINLLSNAIKFTDQGWVRLRGELLEDRGTRLLVRFEVQDTGPGIAPEQQRGLFKAFEQADNSSSRQHGGTGLGLALSRQIALAMGGDAGLDSAPGSGSRFWFTAWLTRGSEVPAESVQDMTRGLHALLVDDLPEALSVIAERLRSMGLEVDALDSGPAALAAVDVATRSGRRYDVILVDWRMQPLDGIETLRRLRDLLGTDMPPSILVSASDDPMIFHQAKRVRCDAVMLKPLTASALHDTLAQVMRKRPTAQPPTLPPQASGGEALLRQRHAGQRVLLAEDNPVNRELAEELLTMVGLVVDTAEDGAAALTLVLAKRYDLVLMDVQMPVMDGLESARAIRAQRGPAMPIIAMTANAFIEDREACLAAGMNDHVAKPVDLTKLYATLLRWLPARGAGAVT